MIAVFLCEVNQTTPNISRYAIIVDMDAYIAVDVGGTRMRAAVYPQEGIAPIAVEKIRTTGRKGTPVERLIDLLKQIWPEKATVKGIGLAAPGYLDAQQGIVISAPNIPGWINLPLRHEIQSVFDVPVFLGNDANLAALGEWKYGAGKGHHHVLYITISTGIGGGIIIDDRLLVGAHGLAAEIGHVTILPDGPKCGCGHRGHLEALASGTAIAKYVAEQLVLGVPSSLSSLENPTAADISLAAEKGDALAIEAFNRAGSFLGMALADFLHTFNPSIVILGGGVSRSGRLIIDPIRNTLPRHVLSLEYIRDLVITTAVLGDDAGLVGALALARG
ncbi:MAG TPA: ROK family protein [Longilinea sp.]|nr:ROK family protein [Longilinea sp.]